MSYVKQNFEDNKTILKASHLQHIEDGIEAIIKGDDTYEQLFDITKITTNVYLDSSGSEISVSPNTDGLAWNITDYMPVNDTDIYYYTNLNEKGNAPMSAFYDTEKNLLSVFKQSQGENFLLTIPDDAKFVRFSIAIISGVSQFEFFKKDLSLKVLNDKIKNLSIGTDNNDAFSNYEICINGDSISTESAGRWPVLLKNSIPLRGYKNIAVGGTRVKGEINSDDRINKIPDTTNIILTLGGTNDWAQDIPLGDLSTIADPETFYGAVDLYIKKVLAKNPNIIVVMGSNPYGCCPGRYTSSDMNIEGGTYNNINEPVHTYAKAIREVAEYNSVYYIPIYEECGINQYNYEENLLREHNSAGNLVYLHPSDTGAAKMLKVIVRHLRNVIQWSQD